jgi:hypothetical protein
MACDVVGKIADVCSSVWVGWLVVPRALATRPQMMEKGYRPNGWLGLILVRKRVFFALFYSY